MDDLLNLSSHDSEENPWAPWNNTKVDFLCSNLKEYADNLEKYANNIKKRTKYIDDDPDCIEVLVTECVRYYLDKNKEDDWMVFPSTTWYGHNKERIFETDRIVFDGKGEVHIIKSNHMIGKEELEAALKTFHAFKSRLNMERRDGSHQRFKIQQCDVFKLQGGELKKANVTCYLGGVVWKDGLKEKAQKEGIVIVSQVGSHFSVESA